MFMSVFRVMIMSALHLMSMKSIQTGNQSSENMNLNLYFYSRETQNWPPVLIGYFCPHNKTRIKSQGCSFRVSSLAFQWALKICNFH